MGVEVDALVITIYAPVNLTAPCIMIFMRASLLRGGLGPGTRDICGPLEIARAVRRVPFGAHKYREFQGPTPRVLDLPA